MSATPHPANSAKHAITATQNGNTTVCIPGSFNAPLMQLLADSAPFDEADALPFGPVPDANV